MGPTLGPPVDRYARRRSSGKEFANAIQGYFHKQAEKEAEEIENEAIEKEYGINLKGVRGENRRDILKHKLAGELKSGESRLASQEEENLINESFGDEGENKTDRLNPAKWKTSQLEKLTAIEAKTPKAKALVNRAKQEVARRAEMQKTRQKVAPMLGALDVINEMKALRGKGNLGFGSQTLGGIYPDVRKDRAEYEQLGKSLISYASMIPIRNQKEFETLSEKLFDPNLRDSDAEGILNAMTRIVENSLKTYSEPDFEGTRKERPPLSSFER